MMMMMMMTTMKGYFKMHSESKERHVEADVIQGRSQRGPCSPQSSIEWTIYEKLPLLGRRACFIQ